MTINFLKYEFRKRIKTLKLNEQAREELFNKFIACWDSGFRCFYCKRRMDLKFENEFSFTIDHTIPKVKNGQDTVENLKFVCRTCNFLKGDMDTKQYENKLDWLIARKNKKEYWEARKATKKDEQMRDAYKGIFEIVNAKKGEW